MALELGVTLLELQVLRHEYSFSWLQRRMILSSGIRLTSYSLLIFICLSISDRLHVSPDQKTSYNGFLIDSLHLYK